MIERILNPRNIRRACKEVMSNKGSDGVDGMLVKELPSHLRTHLNAISTAICNGSYVPQAILGVEIPKSNGKKRLPGIPTVVDRMLQQATHQVISLKFEPEFKEHSYGFRPGRNAHQAVLQAQKNIHEGYDYIVDIDLKSFFDEVDHGILLQLLYNKVKCPITLRLLRKWLQVPIEINGKLTKRTKGVPQGSPISPLLSNTMLHELDKELEKRGHRQAYAWSRTRMGGWAVAQSPILGTTVTLERLARKGYESMLTWYEKVSPQLNEPLYTRSVRTVVVCHEQRTGSLSDDAMRMMREGPSKSVFRHRLQTALCGFA